MTMRLALACAASLALLPLAAWELPRQHELAAVYGQQPMLSIASAGIPLPPARQELPGGAAQGRQRQALKQALIYQAARAKAEHYRVTRANYQTTAALARQHGAPELFVRYQEMLASDTLSRREEYLVSQAQNLLVQGAYGIDTLQIRLLSEALQLPAPAHGAYLQKLPKGGLCEEIPQQPLSEEQVVADLQTMTQVLRGLEKELQGVSSRSTADAAAERLLELLPLWNTCRQTREQLAGQSGNPLAGRLSRQMFETAHASVGRLRKQLDEQDWHHSPSLRFVDELFH